MFTYQIHTSNVEKSPFFADEQDANQMPHNSGLETINENEADFEALILDRHSVLKLPENFDTRVLQLVYNPNLNYLTVVFEKSARLYDITRPDSDNPSSHSQLHNRKSNSLKKHSNTVT